MKDISTVLVMSRYETDSQDRDDAKLEVSCSSTAGMLQVDTPTSHDDISTVSVMDWAECLIAMAVSANDCDSEENVANYITTSGSLSARETTNDEELNCSSTAVSSLSSFDENSLQNEHQRSNFELGSNAIQPTTISLQGRLSSDEINCLATKSSETDIESGFSDLMDSSRLTYPTDKVLAERHQPASRSCVPTSTSSDILTCSNPYLLTVEARQVRPQTTMSDTLHGSQDQLHKLTASSSDQFTIHSPVSSPEVGLELGTPSSFTTSSPQPTNTPSSHTNTSLDTPILEVCPGFTDTETYSKPYSSVSNISDNCPSLYSPTESHLMDTVYYDMLGHPALGSRSPGNLWNAYITSTGELTLPECEVAAVEVVSSDSCQDSTFLQSQDEIINSDTFSNTDSLCQQDSIPCYVYQGNDLDDVTVFTIEAPDASTPHLTQPSSTEHCTDAPIIHATSSHIKIPANLRQEFPSHNIVSYLPHDLSQSPAVQDFNIDLSPGDCNSAHQSYGSRVNSSRLPDADVSKLTFDNPNGYFSHSVAGRSFISRHGEGVTIDVSHSPSIIYSQSNTGNSVVHSRKRCSDETTTASQNPHKQCPTILSTNLDMRTKLVSKLRYEQTRSTQTSWAQTSPSCSVESTHHSLPSHFDFYSDNASDDSSNTTHLLASSASASIQNETQTRSLLPQPSRYSPFLHHSSTEVTYDALLTPSDLYKAFLDYDGVVLPEATQNNPHIHRKISDASDVTVGDSDVSSTHPTTPASCTDGEGSQGSLIADKVKDTLRSKLKAKQETANSFSQSESLPAEVIANLSKSGTGKHSPPPDDAMFSSVAMWSSGLSMRLNSRHSSLSRRSPASYNSQDGSTDDNDTMNDDDDDDDDDGDDEDLLKLTPVHKKRKLNKKDDKDETVEESDESRLAKREKNRLAAQKCRLRRRDKIDTLTQQVQKLEQKQERIKTEVDKLEMEREQLEEMLRLHAFICKRKL